MTGADPGVGQVLVAVSTMFDEGRAPASILMSPSPKEYDGGFL